MEPPDLLEPPRIDEQNRRLCHATSKRTGEPCNAPAMHGMDVCRIHGGSAPQARRSARQRLLDLVDPAIATLAREMEQAESSSDRQRAANSILDRAGYARLPKIDEDEARDILVQRLIELRDARVSRATRGANVIEGAVTEPRKAHSRETE
ncbi:HGGxSTG domain-containing protein [Terrabacter sp. RAF57]|uniref:HGGxSTG domain-containing protein n=1 Tax=Terrabacter sp. RAF57 TaxID=3233063 RepID=UPI003F9B4F32